MNGYMFLGPDVARQVRIDRIRQLEMEHYHTLLMLEEDPKNAATVQAVRELERRIDHHTHELSAIEGGEGQQDAPVAESNEVADQEGG